MSAGPRIPIHAWRTHLASACAALATLLLIFVLVKIASCTRAPDPCEANPPDDVKGTVYDCPRAQGEPNP